MLRYLPGETTKVSTPASTVHHHHHHPTMMNCHAPTPHANHDCSLTHAHSPPILIHFTTLLHRACPASIIGHIAYHYRLLTTGSPLQAHLASLLSFAILDIYLLHNIASNNAKPPARDPQAHRHLRHDRLQQHHRATLPHRRRTLQPGHQHSLFTAGPRSLPHGAPRPLRSR